MRIVTGGAGFIGSRLAMRLNELGQKVVVIDNFDSTLYRRQIKIYRAKILEQQGISVLEGDDLRILKKIESVETVFNLGATAGLSPSWRETNTYFQNNVLRLASSLSRITSHNPNIKLIQASTSSVYGQIVTPQSISSELNPVSPYGVSKLAAEKLIQAHASELGLRFNILRLFSVYGPGQRPDQFFSIVLDRVLRGETIPVFGDGSNSRTNLYVDDAVQAFISADRNFRESQTYDISGNEKITVMQVIERLSSLLNRRTTIAFKERRLGDQLSTAGELTRTEEFLDWKPKTSFREGTERLAADFMSDPELYR